MISFHQPEGHGQAAEQVNAAFHDGVEDGLGVGRRAANHAQDFADHGLLLQRFLGLVEQTDVLDRNHRLGGEGLHQSRLLVGKRAYFGTADGYRPDWYSLAQQRGREYGPDPDFPRTLAPLGESLLFGEYIVYVELSSLMDGQARHPIARDRSR